ncbi:MAG: hypothetical protein BWY10_01740 [Chloroflexi bacterium ADurb.Bin180]|nr:MAG: hypothetical protein BWY10_01740 [Chloroflexi bacterium ADurb.Bin180]
MVKTTAKAKEPAASKKTPAASKKTPAERKTPTAASRKHSESFRGRRKSVTRTAATPAAKPARKPRAATVVLAPDVRLYFPDSDAVNRALRQLIRLIPRRREAKTKGE